MIKSLITAVAIASVSLIAPASVEAQVQTTCYHETSVQAIGHGRVYGCRVSSRYNSNGHKVWDIVWEDGVKSSYVLWDDRTSETFSVGRVYPGLWGMKTNKFGVRLIYIVNNQGSVTGFPID